jgi:hypothetical protein
MQSQGNVVVVDSSIVQQIQDFFRHLPPVYNLIFLYAAVCLVMYLITRGKGFLVAMAGSVLYLIPLWLHSGF